MPDKIKVAFVGCTHPHIFPRYELLTTEPDVELVGGYDPDTNLTAALERQYGPGLIRTPLIHEKHAH